MTTSDGTIDVERLLAERDWLRRLALRLLGDEQDADDLVQDTLRAALERAPRGLDRGGLRKWLTTVARRTTSFRWRSDTHRRDRERAAARTEALPSTEEAVERAATQRLLADSVMALPEPVRSAVVLRYFEGLAYADVARRQGVTQVAARKRVSRGIEVLRGRLDEGTRGDRAAWTAALAPFADLARRTGGTAQGAALMQVKTKWAATAAIAAVLGVVGWTAWGGMRAPDGPTDVAVRSVSEVDTPADEQIAALESVAERVEEVAPVAASATPTEPEARDAFPDRDVGVTGILEVRVSWESDGAAAQDVAVRVMPWGDSDPFLWSRSAFTDEGGAVRFLDVHAGSVGVYLGRGGGGRAEVEPGRTTRLDVVVPSGADVEGRVLDAAGNGVAGATLQVSAHGNFEKGWSVATTAADGRYRIRDVSKGHYVSARAPGLQASGQTRIDGAPGVTVELDIVLAGGGGRLAGQVVDESGTPLEDATVRVTDMRSLGGMRLDDDGRWVTQLRLPRLFRTDAEGRFLATGLGAQSHLVEVRTAMHAPFSETVDVVGGETQEVVLRMKPGRTLTGVVKRESGEPARDAVVRIGIYGAFDSFTARVADDGTFRIDGLDARKIDVRAVEEGHGKVRETLVLPESGALRWEATLVAGGSAAGVVVDSEGEPLAGWTVAATADDPGLFHRRTKTDADGRFELKNIPAPAVSLSVGPADVQSVGIARILANVLPAADPLRIVVPDDALPTGSITGVVRDLSGALSAETRIELSRARDGRWRNDRPEADGRIALERVYPGTWNVTVRAPGTAVWLGRVDVPAGGTGDLGEVLLSPGGHVRVRPVRPGGGAEPEEVDYLWIARLDGDVDADILAQTLEDGRWGPFPEGRVRLRVHAANRVSTVLEVDVIAGETVDVDVVLEQGELWAIELQRDPTEPGPAAAPNTMRSCGYRLRSADGAVLHAVNRSHFAGAMILPFTLLPGRYEIEAWDVFGRTGGAEFDVNAGAGADPTGEPSMTVVLRRPG